MTQIKFYAPVKEMNGEFEKGSGIVMRKKKYRAPNGAVLREGPLQGGELPAGGGLGAVEHGDRVGEVC